MGLVFAYVGVPEATPKKSNVDEEANSIFLGPPGAETEKGSTPDEALVTPEEVIELFESAFIAAETALVQAAAAVSMADSMFAESEECSQSTKSANKQQLPQSKETNKSVGIGTGTVEEVYLGDQPVHEINGGDEFSNNSIQYAQAVEDEVEADLVRQPVHKNLLGHNRPKV